MNGSRPRTRPSSYGRRNDEELHDGVLRVERTPREPFEPTSCDLTSVHDSRETSIG